MPTHEYSTYGVQLQGKADGTQAVIDVAQAAAGPHKLELGGYHVLALGDGKLQTIDLTGDQYRDTPRRKSGTVTVHDIPSFVEYFKKHADDSSEVYGDGNAFTITAVLDANTAGEARWGGHRLVLALRKTDAWKAWQDLDGRLLDQKTFAEHIEDNLPDIVKPAGATMLEIAQTFHAVSKTAFSSGNRLTNGDTRLTFNEETKAKAGGKGELDIPATITLGIRPFEGSAEAFQITARFRYRLEGDQLKLGFRLDRPAEVLAEAFTDTRTALEHAETGVGRPVLNGSPIRA
ncbi:DUF2303 family protein [Streptomyces sp. NPDC046977]|uniref:DUF2303 family protein n=1 Tax=Streptomyces sp. NPDC046977 TaxID=3154703 RepID=UPI0033CC1A59